MRLLLRSLAIQVKLNVVAATVLEGILAEGAFELAIEFFKALDPSSIGIALCPISCFFNVRFPQRVIEIRVGTGECPCGTVFLATTPQIGVVTFLMFLGAGTRTSAIQIGNRWPLQHVARPITKDDLDRLECGRCGWLQIATASDGSSIYQERNRIIARDRVGVALVVPGSCASRNPAPCRSTGIVVPAQHKPTLLIRELGGKPERVLGSHRAAYADDLTEGAFEASPCIPAIGLACNAMRTAAVRSWISECNSAASVPLPDRMACPRRCHQRKSGSFRARRPADFYPVAGRCLDVKGLTWA
jgi:hypothetical protein